MTRANRTSDKKTLSAHVCQCVSKCHGLNKGGVGIKPNLTRHRGLQPPQASPRLNNCTKNTQCPTGGAVCVAGIGTKTLDAHVIDFLLFNPFSVGMLCLG